VLLILKGCKGLLRVLAFSGSVMSILAQQPDLSVFRPSNDTWYNNNPSFQQSWGEPGDIPILGDFTAMEFGTMRSIALPITLGGSSSVAPEKHLRPNGARMAISQFPAITMATARPI